MRLIQTKDYLLLIDEKAEINFDTDYIHAPDTSLFTGLEIGKIKKADAELATKRVGMCFIKVIAYYPLTDEAKELDLPWLPNPFEDNFDLKQEIIKWYHSKSGTTLIIDPSLNTLVDKAQSKQFSLEDMKDILEEGLNWFDGGRDKEIRDSETWFNHYIQSLSNKQLPKFFIPEENYGDGALIKYKTIINSEGKEELVGAYKY